MSTVYIIRENATGIEVTRDEQLSDSLCDFWWTEGNMACDCNRRLEWYRGLPDDAPDDDPALTDDQRFPCSHGKFTLVSVKVNGVEIVKDDKATEAADCG